MHISSEIHSDYRIGELAPVKMTLYSDLGKKSQKCSGFGGSGLPGVGVGRRESDVNQTPDFVRPKVG